MTINKEGIGLNNNIERSLDLAPKMGFLQNDCS